MKLLIWIVVGVAVLIYLVRWVMNIRRALRSGALGSGEGGIGADAIMAASAEILEEHREMAQTEPDPTPDQPILRARYSGWFAVRCDGAEEAVERMGLQDTQPCNWESASIIISSYMNRKTFVTSAVEGWVMLVGPYDSPSGGVEEDGVIQLLKNLSERFGEAQYFYFNSTDFTNAWAMARQGDLVRAYGVIVGEGGLNVVWNEGEVTQGERDADFVFGESGFKGFISDEEVDDNPDCCLYEEATDYIAAQWSVGLGQLGARNDLGAGVGYLYGPPNEA